MVTELRLFVGGIRNVEPHELQQHFERRGYRVIQAQVQKDRDTQQHKGYGFVSLVTDKAAAEVIKEFSKDELQGRIPTINTASPRPARQHQVQGA